MEEKEWESMGLRLLKREVREGAVEGSLDILCCPSVSLMELSELLEMSELLLMD